MSGLIDDLGPLALFGILAAVLSTLAYLPYIRDTARGQTQPQRASWLIWSVLSAIAFASQVYEGATSSLWFAGVQSLATAIIFALSLRFGTGAFLNRKDMAVLGMAAGGLLAWYWMETAVYALAISIAISLLGGIVTISKAYRAPETETYATWILCLVASVLALFAVGSANWILLAYPLYMLVLNSAIVIAITLGRTRGGHPFPAE